jgi:hypothetical protein
MNPESTGQPSRQTLEQAEAELLRALQTPSLSARSEAQARFNLATCLLLRDELARAVVEFRRAAAVCPLWEQSLLDGIRTNLNTARQRVGTLNAAAATTESDTPQSSPDKGSGASSNAENDTRSGIPSDASRAGRADATSPQMPPIDPTRSWVDDAFDLAPAPIRLALGVFCAWAACIPLARRLFGRQPVTSPATAIFAALSAALFASVWWQTRRTEHAPTHAVLMVPNVQPRSGPDDLLHAPVGPVLPAGAELVIVNQPAPASGGTAWARVQSLPLGGPNASQPVWVPADSLELLP